MTDFSEEKILQAIFLDAAEKEFEHELSASEVVSVSPRFQRQMDAMLANPNAWAKRRKRPIWKTALQRIAIFVAVCSLTLGALMTVSPTIRATFTNWIVQFYETYVAYHFAKAPVSEVMPQYEITTLPDGYQLEHTTDGPDHIWFRYSNADGESLSFHYIRTTSNTAQGMTIVNAEISNITINGCPGHLYISSDPEESNAVVWYDEQLNLQFTINGFFDRDNLLAIAESVTSTDLKNKKFFEIM